MNSLIEKAFSSNILEKDEIVFLLQNDFLNAELFDAADKTRKKNIGNKVYLRGLIEFSNICAKNCRYCGLRCSNKKLERYRLNTKNIIECAQKAKNHGIKTVVLQSGEDSFYSIETMQEIIHNLKKLNLAITLSLGEKTYEEYKAYKEAGANRYLLRIETTDPILYKKMHPKMNLNNRITCLKNLKELNYEVGSGCLVGLPNQSLNSLANDLLFLQNLQVDMAGIGPFIANPDTPLAKEPNGSFILALKIMAIMRLLLPKINIPATTSMETLNKNGQIIALQSGANVIMPNVTKINYRKKYIIYPGKTGIEQNEEETILSVKSKIKNIGREISTNFGTSKTWKAK